jgi:hypothetical protein
MRSSVLRYCSVSVRPLEDKANILTEVHKRKMHVQRENPDQFSASNFIIEIQVSHFLLSSLTCGINIEVIT